MHFQKYKSLRLKDFDYSQPGAYFVTICTGSRKNYFGEIKNEEIFLSKTGKIAYEETVNIPSHYENVDIGEFIIMPNHVHMIIFIYDTGVRQTVIPTGKETGVIQPTSLTAISSRLQDIVGSFKSAVTRQTGKLVPAEEFKWQRYFHDHIIRNDRALEYISDYIRMNPAKWTEDIENYEYLSGLSEAERKHKAKIIYRKLIS